MFIFCDFLDFFLLGFRLSKKKLGTVYGALCASRFDCFVDGTENYDSGIRGRGGAGLLSIRVGGDGRAGGRGGGGILWGG